MGIPHLNMVLLDCFGIGGIGMLVLVMLGLLALIGLVKLIILLWKPMSAVSAGDDLYPESPVVDPEEPPAAISSTPLDERSWVARSPLGTSVPLRRALVFLIVAIFFVLGYRGWALYQQNRSPQRISRARDVIQLMSVEMWTDAMSQFDDYVRIRFRYQNNSDRDVDAFNVQFLLRARDGRAIISDQLSIDNPVAAGQTTSWTVKYWSTCDQQFSVEDWHLLTHRDISDFEIEWWPEGLVFSDGEAIH